MSDRKYLDKIMSIQHSLLDRPEKERGGVYSKKLNVWIQENFDKVIADYDEETLNALNIFARIALAIGALHKKQLEDAEKNVVWPKSYFENECSKLKEEVSTNAALKDPYAIINANGQSIPYSVHYKNELVEVNEALLEAANSKNNKLFNILPYINTALQTYKYVENKTSDLENYRQLDKVWVTTPADSSYLLLAEPTEVYQDPLRIKAGQYDQISEWASTTEEEQGQGPWKNFFEFRVLERRGEMVKLVETEAIREKSSTLFSDGTTISTSVSLEFRELLFGAGQGSFPTKTAKNYPNFIDIRQEMGYKNVIYTNMLRVGTSTETIPLIQKYLGEAPILKEEDVDERITRGRALLVVAHEENHPHRRMSSIPLEELKATVNGVKALTSLELLKDIDRESIIWALVGSCFVSYDKTSKARKHRDASAERAMESYYVADTILMNWLDERECFIYSKTYAGFYESKIVTAINELVNVLQDIRIGNTSSEEFYNNYNKQDVWKKFKY